MASCRDIVTRALRTAGIIGIDDDPTAGEADYGLVTLQGLFDGWVASGMFGRLADVYKTEAYTAKEYERVHTSGAPTITIPDTYTTDGDEGDDRPPYDLALIEVQNGATRNVWLYDRSDWVDLVGLTLNSDCPLASRGEHGLSCALAQVVVAPFGQELSRSANLAAIQFKQAVSYKTGSTSRPRETEYF